mmetsp:Transcript_16869/g.47344  ORF Transcript_16869/g.47344 Transcript_16869/m.47344 type:complete len:236 (+) Transcript_16869:640-1347(+)
MVAVLLLSLHQTCCHPGPSRNAGQHCLAGPGTGAEFGTAHAGATGLRRTCCRLQSDHSSSWIFPAETDALTMGLHRTCCRHSLSWISPTALTNQTCCCCCHLAAIPYSCFPMFAVENFDDDVVAMYNSDRNQNSIDLPSDVRLRHAVEQAKSIVFVVDQVVNSFAPFAFLLAVVAYTVATHIPAAVAIVPFVDENVLAFLFPVVVLTARIVFDDVLSCRCRVDPFADCCCCCCCC